MHLCSTTKIVVGVMPEGENLVDVLLARRLVNNKWSNVTLPSVRFPRLILATENSQTRQQCFEHAVYSHCQNNCKKSIVR